MASRATVGNQKQASIPQQCLKPRPRDIARRCSAHCGTRLHTAAKPQPDWIGRSKPHPRHSGGRAAALHRRFGRSGTVARCQHDGIPHLCSLRGFWHTAAWSLFLYFLCATSVSSWLI